MDKIRKKKSDDSGTAQDWLSTIFLLYMGTLYPLIMHDKYFDITLTKYKAFEVALCVYAVLMVLAVLLDVFDGKKPFVMFKYRSLPCSCMSVWDAACVLENVCSRHFCVSVHLRV